MYTLKVEIALRDTRTLCARELSEYVKVEVIAQVTTQTGYRTPRAVFVGADAGTALYVSMRVDELHVCVATGRENIVTANKVTVSIEVTREVCERECASSIGSTARLQERVATVRLERAVERRRLCDLRSRVVVHVACVGVGFEAAVDLVVTACAKVPTLNRALVVIAGTKIISFSRATCERRKRTVFLLEYGTGYTVTERAVKAAEIRRTDAVDSGSAAERTGACVAVATEELFLLFVATKDSNVTGTLSVVYAHEE